MSQSVLEAVQAGRYDRMFGQLYGNAEQAHARYQALVKGYETCFGASPTALFSAPGRTEIGGNHTDHQHGRVLAGSVNLDVIAAVAPCDEPVIRIQSEGFKMDTIDLARLTPQDAETNHSASLIRGIAAKFTELGFKVGGFNAYTTSNVLKGSGLSSSAAFEVLVGTIISHLFCGGEITAVKIAQIGQYAENVFFGKPCGLMDQTASSVGGAISIDFADPRTPVVKQANFNFTASGHALCIIDSGADHADLTDEYASIPTEMKKVAACFDCDFLRDVSETEFYANIARVRNMAGDRATLRAMHIFADNARVPLQVRALEEGNFDAFLALINESGRSSQVYLQNVTPTGATSHQEVSLALAMCERLLGGRGASRVHGGGFAGTVQAFVPHDMLEAFRVGIEAVLGEGSCHVLSIRPLGGVQITAE